MPYSPELLGRYSHRLVATSQELCRQAAAAYARGAKLRALAKEAAVVAQAARAVSDAMHAAVWRLRWRCSRRLAGNWPGAQQARPAAPGATASTTVVISA
jgi:hypothetical protein